MIEKTLLPSEPFLPITWSVVFSDKTCVTSAESTWASFSQTAQVDGVTLDLSRNPIEHITVLYAGTISSLVIEGGAHCFGFHRWRMPIGGTSKDSQWLYSAFGFFQETERIILQITETSGRMLVQKRATPFLL